jgi:nicotinamidase/pyrazinamidase
LQNDFLAGGALAVTGGDEVIELANRLQPKFDLVVATQDWHPPDHGSFAASHPGQRVGETVELGGLPQILWPTHCVENTHGAALAPGLSQARIAHSFHKGTDREIDSYSGFFDNGHRRSTGLNEYLRGHDVTDVYVMGLATDYCVKATAIDARSLGFGTTLVLDACRGVELHEGDVERAVAQMRSAGVMIEQSRRVLDAAPFAADSQRCGP